MGAKIDQKPRKVAVSAVSKPKRPEGDVLTLNSPELSVIQKPVSFKTRIRKNRSTVIGQPKVRSNHQAIIQIMPLPSPREPLIKIE